MIVLKVIWKNGNEGIMWGSNPIAIRKKYGITFRTLKLIKNCKVMFELPYCKKLLLIKRGDVYEDLNNPDLIEMIRNRSPIVNDLFSLTYTEEDGVRCCLRLVERNKVALIFEEEINEIFMKMEKFEDIVGRSLYGRP